VPAEGPTVLIATPFTGLKATDDNGTWRGVTGLALPFP
jgi:hypothetical protein